MLVLDAATVQRCIGMEEAIEASARAFVLTAEGRAVVPDRHVLSLDPQGSRSARSRLATLAAACRQPCAP
jgi:ornithine cyclodeaminase/alanine dehydrogenase-like protein (mu-crystallin family)